MRVKPKNLVSQSTGVPASFMIHILTRHRFLSCILAPEQSWKPENMKKDFELLVKLVRALDSEKDIGSNPLFEQENAVDFGSDDVVAIAEQMDKFLLYACRVHGVDYYKGIEIETFSTRHGIHSQICDQEKKCHILISRTKLKGCSCAGVQNLRMLQKQLQKLLHLPIHRIHHI